ncbi:MAG TPA: T9SS type A sorting domain-containing protein, partial [Bacteroidia bacterium]|nr:T9SS type A sorting domain-containing protein [Bacteroidia bacterium]
TGLQPCSQDCYGTWGGTAYIDTCGICVGGNTGLWDCDTINAINNISWYNEVSIYPNPLSGEDIIVKAGNYSGNTEIFITDLTGKLIFKSECYMENGKCIVNLHPVPVDGLYLFKIHFSKNMMVVKRLSIYGQ